MFGGLTIPSAGRRAAAVFLAAFSLLRGGSGLACALVVPDDHPPGSIFFAGRRWSVVSDPAPRGPGPNVFDGRNVVLDGRGRLVLETAYRGGRWTSAQIALSESLGYGRYEIVLAPADKGMDVRAVFGFFTWDDDSAFANREIDIELARWSEREAPNLNFTVQPWDGFPERQKSFEIDLSSRTALSFDWRPDRILFSVESGGGSVSWEFPENSGAAGAAPFAVPPAGNERVVLNLWLFRGAEPESADRIAVEDFSFRPAD